MSDASTHESTASRPSSVPGRGRLPWLKAHLPALLFGWFFFGMVLSGLVSPAERVAQLESSVIQEGWHLSMLAAMFGTPVVVAYWLRVSGRWR